MGARDVKEKVEEVLSKIGARAGVDLQLRSFHEGVATVKFFKHPISCPVKTGETGPLQAEREMILEVLEEQLKGEIPEVKRIIVE